MFVILEHLPYLKQPLKRWPTTAFQDQSSINAGQKYCRMLQESILQYFRPSLSYHLSLRPLLCLFLRGRLRQVLLYFMWIICCAWEYNTFVVQLVEWLTCDLEVLVLNPNGNLALFPWARHILPSLLSTGSTQKNVLLLLKNCWLRRKASNQTYAACMLYNIEICCFQLFF